jgi:hypothetical protein
MEPPRRLKPTDPRSRTDETRRESQGQLRAAILRTGQDLTERNQAEQALRQLGLYWLLPNQAPAAGLSALAGPHAYAH